jgi:hypothetical protein
LLPTQYPVTGNLEPAPPHQWALQEARAALTSFFDELAQGSYQAAAETYGGSLETLIYHNPDIDPDDRAVLIQRACQVNGYQCLKLRQITAQELISVDEALITVEFLNRDGSRFQLGPCCGATEAEMPPVWRFPYTLRKIGDRWMVMDLPIYVP